MAAKIKSSSERSRHFIKDWRELKNMTQEQLAAAIGSTSASISRIENGAQPYTQDSLEAIARVLDVSPADLLASAPGDAPEAADEPQEPFNRALLALTVAGLFQKIGGLGETEAEILAQAALEVASMPDEQLAAATDPVALAEGLSSFARRANAPLKRQ